MAEKKNYLPVYYGTAAAAYETGWGAPLSNLYRMAQDADIACARDIDAEMTISYDGKNLDTSCLDALIDKHGEERVRYVLSTYIQKGGRDMWISEENKAWAKTVRISDSPVVYGVIKLNAEPRLINILTDRMRELDEKKEDAPGTGKESPTNFSAGKDAAADAAAEEKNMAEEKKDMEGIPFKAAEDGGFVAVVPRYAVRRRYDTETVIGMPGGGKYAGYKFALGNSFVRELDDGSMEFKLDGKDDVTLVKLRGKITVPVKELSEEFRLAKAEDFKTVWHEIEVPKKAVFGRYPSYTRVYMPDDGPYKGMNATISNAYKRAGHDSDDVLMFSIPEDLDISVKRGFGSAASASEVMISGKEFCEIAEEQNFHEKKEWTRVTVPESALLHRYDKTALFKMPRGQYSAYTFKVPVGMVSLPQNGELELNMPADLSVTVRKKGAESEIMNVSQLRNVIDGKTAEDFISFSGNMHDTRAENFYKMAEKIKAAVPEYMSLSPNWIGANLGTRKTRRWAEFPVAPSALRNYEKDDEAYVRNIGGAFDDVLEVLCDNHVATLGFCFDGTGVSCLELDECLDADGEPMNDAARFAMDAARYTYVEKTPSGRGLRVFGMKGDAILAGLSENGDFEYYSDCGFVAVTGDAVQKCSDLHEFSLDELGKFTSEKLGAPRDVGPMTEEDERILGEVVAEDKSGDTARLLAGENTKRTEYVTDLGFLSDVGFKTEYDIDAMKRIYKGTRGKDKSPEYIDHITKSALVISSFVRERMTARKLAEAEERAARDIGLSGAAKTKKPGKAD
ncbi:MAG: DUF3849 domain-containing protein [Clostridia bacterium]|nr:DUF3849 domain-containing protein [Clostridia bacterium]